MRTAAPPGGVCPAHHASNGGAAISSDTIVAKGQMMGQDQGKRTSVTRLAGWWHLAKLSALWPGGTGKE